MTSWIFVLFYASSSITVIIFCLIVSYLDIGKPLQDGTWYTASSAAVIKRRVREGREREREHVCAGAGGYGRPLQ